MSDIRWGLALAMAGALQGCAVVSVASAAVTVTTTAAGLAVDAVEVAGKGVVKAGEVVVDAARPSVKPVGVDSSGK